MTRRALVASIVVAALLASAAGYLMWSRARTDRYRAVLVRYDTALASALSALDPGKLGSLAGEQETQRVTSYITMLWGQSKRLESRLLTLEIASVGSSGGSALVTARETWDFREVDRVSGAALGPARQVAQTVTYTISEAGSTPVVELSRVDEGDGSAP